MAYTIEENQIGVQPIGAISNTQQHPGGKLVRATDPSMGYGEFIYLQGVNGTVQGSVVTAGGVTGGVPTRQTALVANTPNLNTPIAVATGPILSGQWGWYQIAGICVVATNGTFAAPGSMYIGAPGQVTGVAAAGKQIVNAQALTANGTPGPNQVLAQIDRSYAQGAIT